MTTGPGNLPHTLDVPDFVPCPYEQGLYWIPPGQTDDGFSTVNMLRVKPSEQEEDATSLQLEWYGVSFLHSDPDSYFPFDPDRTDLHHQAVLDLSWSGCLNLKFKESCTPHFCEPDRTAAFAVGLLAAQRFGRQWQRDHGGFDE